MKKASNLQSDPDGLGLYDLSNGVRGKYAGSTGPESKVIVYGKPYQGRSYLVYRVPITRLRSDSHMRMRLNGGSILFSEDLMAQSAQSDA